MSDALLNNVKNRKKEKKMKNPDAINSYFGAAHDRYAVQFLPEPLQTAGLDDYPNTTYAHRQAVEAAREYIADVRGGGRGSLMVYGPDRALSAWFVAAVWRELAPFVRCRSSYEEVVATGTADNLLFVGAAGIPDLLQGEGKKTWLAHAFSAFLAGICDLDRFPTGQWANALQDLLDQRLRCNRLPTLVTMQITPREFRARYGEAGDAIVGCFERTGGVFIRMDPLGDNSSAIAEQVTPTEPDEPQGELDAQPVAPVVAVPALGVSNLQQALDAMPRTWGSGN
ncbi:MAG: hypothetical protein K8T26_11130 [Lentisphaerae bacterium]|nr:hypothetical protein [Lentisphaerota bacterium]